MMESNVRIEMLRRLCWGVILLLYWATVVHFLRVASPVFIDGGGPMPSFYWGHAPQPEMGEYMRRQSHYDLLYSIPYYVAGLVITFIGCGATPLILRRLRASPTHAFRNSAGTTLALVLLVAMAFDACTLLGAWKGPLFLLTRYLDAFTILSLCKVLLPACILSGAIAVWQRRLLELRD